MSEENQIDASPVEASEPAESNESEVIQTAVAAPRRFKVKVDETEEDVSEEELLKGFQMAKSSDKRFKEAAQLRKEAEKEKQQIQDLLKQVKDNPDLLEQLGIDLDGYSEKRMLRNLERSLKTPEELELEELRAERQKRLTHQQRAQQEAEFHQASEQIDNEIFESLSSAGLKATPRLVARLAEQMLASLDDDGNRMKASDAFARVRNDYKSDVSELLENLTPEQLASEYPSLVKKLRDYSISQAQQQAVPTFRSGTTPKTASDGKPAKRKSFDDIVK